MGIRIIKHNKNNAKDINCLLLEVDTTGVEDKYGIVYSKEKGKFIVEPVRTGITSGEHDEITQNIFNNYYNFTKQEKIQNARASKDSPKIVNVTIPKSKDYNFGKLELLKYVDGQNKNFQSSFSNDDIGNYKCDCNKLIDFNGHIKLKSTLEYELIRNEVSYDSLKFDYINYYEIYNIQLLDDGIPVDLSKSDFLFLIQDEDGTIYTYKNKNLIKLDTLKLSDRLFIENGFSLITGDFFKEHSKDEYLSITKYKEFENSTLYKSPIDTKDILNINSSDLAKKHNNGLISISKTCDTSICTLVNNNIDFDCIKVNITMEPLLKNKKLLVYHKDNDKKVKLKISVSPKPQIIISNTDINLDFIEKLLNIRFDVINEDNIKYAFSSDNGCNWYSCKDGILKDITLDEISKYGMETKDFNDMNEELWDKILGPNKHIRFAYYINSINKNDISEIQNIKITYKSKGEFASLIQGKQYDYSYINGNILSIKLYEDGNYKINYYNNSNSLMDNKLILKWEEFDL